MNEFEDIQSRNPTYRLGQHFINRFIVDSSSEDMQKLWNERDQQVSMLRINKIVREYNWAWHYLPELPLNASPFLTETGEFKL